jgi:[ribosomal protein S5]-alanine N-acetyltransferase
MKTLTSQRLTLRPLREGEEAVIYSLLGDVKTMTHLFAGRAMNRTEALAFINEHFTSEHESIGMGVLVDHRSSDLVGFAGIIATSCIGQEDYEFGFVVDEKLRGRRYATEIGCRQIVYGLQVLGLPRILALAHPDNRPSLAVIEGHLEMVRVASIPATHERGDRDVFCRERCHGMPDIWQCDWTQYDLNPPMQPVGFTRGE